MATISISVPDDQDVRIMKAVSEQGGYQPKIPDPAFVASPEHPGPAPLIDNPQTRKQFVRQMLITFITDQVRAYEANTAAEKARAAAIKKADAEVVLS